MKIILVSDLHLVAPGETLFGMDPLRGLETCIADINRTHADADLVVFAGDLTNDGEAAAYEALAERVAHLAPPHRFMMGNHDDRARFLRMLPQPADEDGFVQSSVDIDGARIILLDTLWPGHVAGLLCDARLKWLDRRLGATAKALIFLHHPPFRLGIPALDECRLSEPDRLLSLIRKHGNVRHLFAGHVHRLAHGSWQGIPFTTVRGTNHQSALRLDGPHEVSFESPAYGVVLVDRDEVIVHTQEFSTGA